MAPGNRRKSALVPPVAGRKSLTSTKDSTRARMEQMAADRTARREALQAQRDERDRQQALYTGDVDFIGLVREWRRQHDCLEANDTNYASPLNPNIRIAVRKRPLAEKETLKEDHDAVTCRPSHREVWIHAAKLKVDGITKYLTHTAFQFDHAFGEISTTEDVYVHSVLPLVDFCAAGKGGRATVFCYGQTGSGKTYTMNGIQQILSEDLYSQIRQSGHSVQVSVAYFELYGGYIQDLLHERKRCKLLEDGKGEVNITGLQEVEAPTPEDFLLLVEEGISMRTTHTTEANDTSSRSHAICQIFLRDTATEKLRGKFSLVDLAGSERGTDTKSHNAQRRTESAEINTSLLSLKECIRALGQQQQGTKSKHVPYRGSKLTLILKDCFTSKNTKTTMIATVSPGASSADHSLNTLRYADRIKEQRTSSGRATRSKKVASTFPSKALASRIQKIKAGSSHSKQSVQSEGALTIDTNDVATFFEEDDDEDSAEVSSGADLLDTDAEDGSREKSPKIFSRHGSALSDVSLNGTNYYADEENSSTSVAHIPSEEFSSQDEEEENFSIGSPTHIHSTPSPRVQSTPQDQGELRSTVRTVLQLEEGLLNQHMTNIQENAEMLTEEGKLLQLVEDCNVSDQDMDAYAATLEEFLNRKLLLISRLQGRLDEFKVHLAKEQEISFRGTQLSQY